MTAARFHSSNYLIGLAIAAALLAPVLIYFDTARSIVSIWNNSDTFAHGYIILPISLWLIWRRRQTLALMSPTPYWPALLLLTACGFGWLLAELGGVQVARQYAFAAMIPVAAIAVLGLRLSWSMAFPLFFLLLAVPFGEVFIEPLIGFTADFTVAALQATGIPVWRSGTSFEIPSGSWSVVEACSGVRYLISSVTLGSLYAYLTYRSRVRQAAFVILSIIVPIIANGLRAYMIVMIGHLSGMQLAVGVDHLIYGWVFFGLVMFLMFWIGSFWREDLLETPAPTTPHNAETINRSTTASRVLAAAIGTVACLAVWPIYGRYIERAGVNPRTAELTAFHAHWQNAVPFTNWKPHFFPANAELYRFFQRDMQQVGVSVMYYRNQQRGAELITSSNRLVADHDPMWHRLGTSTHVETIANRSLAVRETEIQGVSGSILVWSWYWTGGKFTASDYVGKILQTKEKFLVRGDDSASLMVFAPYAENPNEARSALHDFLAENLPSLEATLVSNKKK